MSSRVNARGLAAYRAARRTRPRTGAEKKLALLVGGVGTFVLALSVWECTTALHDLTGMPYVLAAMLAVGIDGNLVACEMATVLTSRESTAHTWGERYVRLAVGLSVVLNAAAAAEHASGYAMRVVAVPVGGVVPILVYMAGRVAGGLWTGK